MRANIKIKMKLKQTLTKVMRKAKEHADELRRANEMIKKQDAFDPDLIIETARKDTKRDVVKKENQVNRRRDCKPGELFDYYLDSIERQRTVWQTKEIMSPLS